MCHLQDVIIRKVILQVRVGNPCVCVCVYIYILTHTLPIKSIWPPTKNFIYILKVLFLMKQVKHHNVFIYYIKYKFSSVTLTLS